MIRLFTQRAQFSLRRTQRHNVVRTASGAIPYHRNLAFPRVMIILATFGARITESGALGLLVLCSALFTILNVRYSGFTFLCEMIEFFTVTALLSMGGAFITGVLPPTSDTFDHIAVHGTLFSNNVLLATLIVICLIRELLHRHPFRNNFAQV